MARKVTELVSAGIAQKMSLEGGEGFHTHAPADETKNGFMTKEDKILLNTIEEGAQKNQNSFSSVNNVIAKNPTDSLNVVGGVGITVSNNPSDNKLTITATGTATPGAHGAAHNNDGTDPIPDLVSVTEQLADKAIVPKIIVPELNYNNALIRAHDAVQPGGIIYLPQGKEINFTTWTVTKQDVRITGGGVLKGKIIVRTNDTTGYYSGVLIENLTFDTTGVSIELKRGNGIRILNNTFKNNDKPILIQPEAIDYDDIHHCVGSVIISDNYFKMVNYMVYIQALEEVKNLTNFDIWKICGDVTISNNHAKVAKICHIYADIIDGLVVDGNTLFHYGSESKVATKTYCVYVGTWGSQVVVTDNELFESGLEAIYLYNCQNIIIDANNIVQPGQVNLRSGIKLDYSGSGDDVPGTNTAFAVITNNIVHSPSKYGIELKNQSYGYASGNFIFNPSDSYAYYGTELGNPAMNTVTHYGVYVDGDVGITPFKITAENYTTTSGLARNHNYNYYPSNEGSHIDITNPATTQLPCSYKIINLDPSAVMTVSDIVNGFEGQEITVLSFNGNVTIKNNSKLRLLNATDYVMPSFSSLRLQYYGGWWIEVARTKLTA